jgi:hypothetical protein
MKPSDLMNALPPVPAQSRLAVHTRLLSLLSTVSQVLLMVALFVMWKVYHVPFGKAFERCFVAGVSIYVTLGVVAAILLTVARVQPVHFLLRQLLGVVSVLIFGALHYVFGYGILKSAAAWALIYFAARILVARMEARALHRFRG